MTLFTNHFDLINTSPPVHPNNQHNGGGALPIKPVDAPLYVVTTVSNPQKYRQRYHLYRVFEQYVKHSGGILYTIEQATGNRQFEVTDPNNPQHIQVTTTSQVWHKENLLNLAIARLPNDWKYVAWVDADVAFARPDWVYETIHQLQVYSVVQMFSQAVDLAPDFSLLDKPRDGIISAWTNEDYGDIINHAKHGSYGGYGAGNRHPGYAWACTREAFNHLGGLLDWAVVGSADWHMSAALVGQVDKSLSPAIIEACPEYTAMCREWQNRAVTNIKYNIGHVSGLVLHYWHGKKINRRYADRWKIIVNNKFNPLLDLKKDSYGMYQLTDRNVRLREDLRKYFSQRDEDSIDLV